MRWDLIFLLLLTSLSSSGLKPDFSSYLVVWNVGQGQMISFVSPSSCHHFDMGGERFPRKVRAHCSGKLNSLFLSHADVDHMNFIERFVRQVSEVCLAQAPLMLTKPWQWKILARLPACTQTSQADTEFLVLTPRKVSHRPLRTLPKDILNRLSHIFILKTKVLIPGDSTKEMEKNWLSQLKEPHKIEILIAGHHGSSTSTSWDLLINLPNLKTAMVSARHRKYGHPHRDVLNRLKKRGIQPLLTEKSDHILIKL